MLTCKNSICGKRGLKFKILLLKSFHSFKVFSKHQYNLVIIYLLIASRFRFNDLEMLTKLNFLTSLVFNSEFVGHLYKQSK